MIGQFKNTKFAADLDGTPKAKFAECIGIDRTTLNRFERGLSMPALDVAAAMAIELTRKRDGDESPAKARRMLARWVGLDVAGLQR